MGTLMPTIAVPLPSGFESTSATASSHRAEDLVGEDAHLGGDVVDQRGPEPEAVRVDVGRHAVAVCLGHQRTHVGVAELRGLLERRAKHGDETFDLLAGFLDEGATRQRSPNAVIYRVRRSIIAWLPSSDCSASTSTVPNHGRRCSVAPLSRAESGDMRMGVSSDRTNWLSSSAAGRMNSSLLRSDPHAMRLIIGSSRSAAIPCTC